ncbi:unnamed protein product [Brassica rapa subsp. trilocularis]
MVVYRSHNHELLQILLCWTDLPSISRFRRFLLGLTMAALKDGGSCLAQRQFGLKL